VLLHRAKANGDAQQGQYAGEDAAAAAAVDVFFICGIGDFGGVEAFALVFDGDVDALVADAVVDADLFGAVQLVAVFDGVDERFFEGKFEGEEIGLAKVMFFTGSEDFIFDIPCLVEAAAEVNFGPGHVRGMSEFELTSWSLHLTPSVQGTTRSKEATRAYATLMTSEGSIPL